MNKITSSPGGQAMIQLTDITAGRTPFTLTPLLGLLNRAQAESGTGPTAMCERSTAILSKSEKPFLKSWG